MGLKRRCVEYGKAKHGVYRCKRFAKSTASNKYPVCPPKKSSMRSPGLLRGKGACARPHKVKARKSHRRTEHRRRSRR